MNIYWILKRERKHFSFLLHNEHKVLNILYPRSSHSVSVSLVSKISENIPFLGKVFTVHQKAHSHNGIKIYRISGQSCLYNIQHSISKKRNPCPSVICKFSTSVHTPPRECSMGCCSRTFSSSTRGVGGLTCHMRGFTLLV